MVGAWVGKELGWDVGKLDGWKVGWKVGLNVGFKVGSGVGESVGDWVGEGITSSLQMPHVPSVDKQEKENILMLLFFCQNCIKDWKKEKKEGIYKRRCLILSMSSYHKCEQKYKFHRTLFHTH